MARSKPQPKPQQKAKTKLKPRMGLPAPESITGIEEHQTSKGVLRIIHTNERDEYDPPEPKDAPATTPPRGKS